MVENIRILETKSKLESKRNIFENKIKENIESVEIFSNIGKFRCLRVRVYIELPRLIKLKDKAPALILKRARLNFVQLSNSKIQVLVLEGLILYSAVTSTRVLILIVA